MHQGRRRLSRYRFAHALFQQYLYNDLSPGECRLLHEEIAAVLEELRTALFLRKGDVRKARKHLDLARGLNPNLRGAKRLEPFLLFAEEEYGQARKRAQRWMEDYPDDRAVDAVLVRALLKLGWWDLAALRLAAWPRLHPEALTELLDLWEEVEEVRATSALAPEGLVLAGR